MRPSWKRERNEFRATTSAPTKQERAAFGEIRRLHFSRKMTIEFNNSGGVNTPISNPETISRFKKERFLLSMSEDAFRDTVVRPLFLRQGLQDGRDLCGVSERGKDAIFVSVDELGIESLYAIQTKKGTLTMSRRVGDNLIEAITQLKTAVATAVPIVAKHKKVFPSRVFLCCSGKINDNARQHIIDEVKDPRISFLDADDLIPRIDKHFPELWLGIDSELFPYFRAVKKLVEVASDSGIIVDILPGGAAMDAATDAMFVPLRLHRAFFKVERTKAGQLSQTAVFENLPVTGVVNRKERLILIIGEAGAGKSTSMRRVAYLLADKGLNTEAKCKVPVLLRATEVWASRERPLVDVCVESTMRLMNSTKPSFANEDLEEGRVVILIDALDELADDDARKAVILHAHAFHKDYPRCQIIATSRPYNFLDEVEELKHFVRFNLTPINHKQAQQIINRLERKRGLSAEHSNEVLRRLQQVHGMELNPLLVTIFAATSDYARRDIPANITELFKKFTEWMLGRWDSSKGLAQQYHAPLKDFLLKTIAFELHRRRMTSLDLDEFKTAIRVELEHRGRQADFDQLYDEILNRSGLLRVLSGRVEFRHHLLQEFFAGRGIPSSDQLEAIVFDPWWQRPIVFYFGENPNEVEPFRKIMSTLTARAKPEVFASAQTLGLALQACYLVKTAEKEAILAWVIETLSDAKTDFLREVDPKNQFPLGRFLDYYILGRDSVACDALCSQVDSLRARFNAEELSEEQRQMREFWMIAGLLECGDLEKVRDALANFQPHDMRLLLGIYLGCFLTVHSKVTSKTEKKLATELIASLAHDTRFLREQILTELKTELLELRQGKIKAIELPKETESVTNRQSNAKP